MEYVLSKLRLWAKTDMVAAVSEEGSLSYRDLDKRSDAVATMLLSNYRRGEAVCLWGDKENDMLTYIVACMKSGHPYVILSSYFPALRIKQITELAAPCVMLCAADDPPDVGIGKRLFSRDVDRLANEYGGEEIPFEERLQGKEILTYFFTSGSTGIPKCVPVTVDTATNISVAYGDETEKFISSDLKNAVQKQLICLNIASYAFCSSIDVLFNNMGRFGMVLYAVSHEQSSQYETLYPYIKKANPHTFDCSPQFLSMCLTDPEFNEKTFSNLRMLSVGGENLSRRIGLGFMEKFPNVPLCNGYGATEMCAGPMWCTVTREMLDRYDVMPIGTPVAGSSCFIVDEEDHVVAEDGVTGELVVVGNCLSSGYLNDPERTAAVFRKTENGEPCYHTNDLVVRYDGQYFYVGRKDNLVKVGGYRVEIDEVELNISRIKGVEACAVVPVIKEGRTVMLAAYIVMNEKPASVVLAIKAIRGELLDHLQPYMVPQQIKFVDELPLNANGKVDRVLLKKQSAIR